MTGAELQRCGVRPRKEEEAHATLPELRNVTRSLRGEIKVQHGTASEEVPMRQIGVADA